MITEDYVSFEIAKLLKEKGFDVVCITKYRPDGNVGFWTTDDLEAPTLQMARKWLREVHNIDIEIHTVRHLHNKWYSWFVTSDKHVGTNNKREEKYEEACEAAIKYCLENLI